LRRKCTFNLNCNFKFGLFNFQFPILMIWVEAFQRNWTWRKSFCTLASTLDWVSALKCDCLFKTTAIEFVIWYNYLSKQIFMLPSTIWPNIILFITSYHKNLILLAKSLIAIIHYSKNLRPLFLPTQTI
jgi:hypothetical protein